MTFSYCIAFNIRLLKILKNSYIDIRYPPPLQGILWIHPFHPSNKCQPNRPAARWNPWQLLLPPPGPSKYQICWEFSLQPTQKSTNKKPVELVNDNLITNYEVIDFGRCFDFFLETELQGEFMNVSLLKKPCKPLGGFSTLRKSHSVSKICSLNTKESQFHHPKWCETRDQNGRKIRGTRMKS